MNLENFLWSAAGAFGAVAYVQFISPLQRASKHSGVPIYKLDIAKTLALDIRLQEWSQMIPLRETDNILTYIRKEIGENAVVRVAHTMNTKDAPFPSYWDKMYERSLALKRKVEQVYALPEIANYLKA